MAFQYLEVSRGVEVGRRYLLADGAISIGRSSSNSISLHPGEKSVSGHHMIIYKSPDRILLQDLQSTNGTYVNEEKVGEKELETGDEVGFGKMGPRFKLVESDTELSLEPQEKPVVLASVDSTQSKTMDDADTSRRRPPPRTKEDAPSRLPRDEEGFPISGSHTLEVEQRLLEKAANAEDMKALLKDANKLQRIVDRGNIGETQAGMLLTAHHASKGMRRQWFVILGIVVGVSLVAVLYFAARAFQYKKLVDHGLTLEEQLDNIDKRIAEMNDDPEANREEIRTLISKFENTKEQLTDVKSDIRDQDKKKFYSDPIEKRIDEIMMRLGETGYHIPPQMVERVKHHIDVYSGRLAPTIGRYLARRSKYMPMIRPILREHNLPEELAFVSMLESGFNPKALSHAGARGLWQFMPRTARSYGLRVDDQVDDRLNPRKSTVAAAEYFKDLIAIFGGKRSVMLAMAAYNAGEGRVIGALRKIDDPVRNRDFWYIYRLGLLAEETNEYIPRIISLMIISEDPKSFGFDAVASARPVTSEMEEEDDFLELDFSDH